MCTASTSSPAEALRQQLKDAGAQRDAVEAEIVDVKSRLGDVGERGSLVDKEGFPRADVDLYQVRRDRNRLVCLTNDHKALTDKMAALLADLHAATRNGQEVRPAGPSGAGSNTASGQAAPAASAVPSSDAGAASGGRLVPFAMVDEVSPGSPAADGGLEVGDQVCTFGSVESSEQDATALLHAVAAHVGANEGRAVTVTVLRQGLPVRLTIVPQRWSGRGLLGAHLRPLR